jgi:hypothetical protein
MMNKTKYLLNLSLAPVYFLLVLVTGIIRAFQDATLDTLDAIRETRRQAGK